MALAVQAKMVTDSQIEDARRLQTLLMQNGFKLTLPEILARKEYISPQQARLLNIAVRYEEIREDDLALGAFLVKKGFLPEEKVRDCLNAQEQPYREGRLLPRLRDLVVQKNYLTSQQLQVIMRARQQFDPSARPPSGPLPAMDALPEAEPETSAGPLETGAEGRPKGAHGNPPESPVPEAVEALSPMPLPPQAPLSIDAAQPGRQKAEPRLPARSESAFRVPIILGPKEVEAGLVIEHLKVAYRKSRLREGAADEITVTIIDVEGVIDAHTFKKFDHYLTAAIDNKGPLVILNCEKLDYVSSAGIGVLAGATKRCRDRQGDLRLCCVNDKVKRIINLVGLQSMLRTYEGERGALMSFKYMGPT